MQRFINGKSWFSAAGAALLLSSCAAIPPSIDTIPPLANQPVTVIEDIDFLAVSEPMKQFVQSFAPTDMPKQKRAWNLSYSMLDPALVHFEYDATTTLSAPETFRHRTGNCLSFSAMFIAIAREAGLKAWFQEVKVPPQWTNVDETFLVSMHVNAVVKGHGRGANFVVDVSGTRRSEWLETEAISDTEAFAQFYNNLGAEALVRQNLPEAYAYFIKALELDPRASYIWSNLAVTFNRNGQTDVAKSIYLNALDINAGELTALNNLQQLYFDEGNFALAEVMESRVERYRRKNPWFMYQLSMEAIDEERYQDAVDLLQNAIKLNDREYRFHYALALAWLKAGNNEEAQDSLDRARQMAPAASDVSRSGLSQLLLNVDK